MDSTEKMTRMVNELLAISKRESEAVEVRIEKIELYPVLKLQVPDLSGLFQPVKFLGAGCLGLAVEGSVQ